MLKFSLAIFSLLTIYFINKYRKEIGKKTKLIDKPDKIRKLHTRPTPLLGGIMVFSSFFLINLYLRFFQDFNYSFLIIFLIFYATDIKSKKVIIFFAVLIIRVLTVIKPLKCFFYS